MILIDAEKLKERVEQEYKKLAEKLELENVKNVATLVKEIFTEMIEIQVMEDGMTRKVASWVPVRRRVPNDDREVLLSFSNFAYTAIGRYEEGEYEGEFVLRDGGKPCSLYDLEVTAWAELPKRYEG